MLRAWLFWRWNSSNSLRTSFSTNLGASFLCPRCEECSSTTGVQWSVVGWLGLLKLHTKSEGDGWGCLTGLLWLLCSQLQHFAVGLEHELQARSSKKREGGLGLTWRAGI